MQGVKRITQPTPTGILDLPAALFSPAELRLLDNPAAMTLEDYWHLERRLGLARVTSINQLLDRFSRQRENAVAELDFLLMEDL